jgi:hypothetical protein
MNAVFIGPEQKAALTRMKAYALAHPLTLADLRELAEADNRKVHRHAAEHYCKIPIGIEVGLTYERQGPMHLWHGSFSVDIHDRVPGPEVVTRSGEPDLRGIGFATRD